MQLQNSPHPTYKSNSLEFTSPNARASTNVDKIGTQSLAIIDEGGILQNNTSKSTQQSNSPPFIAPAHHTQSPTQNILRPSNNPSNSSLNSPSHLPPTTNDVSTVTTTNTGNKESSGIPPILQQNSYPLQLNPSLTLANFDNLPPSSFPRQQPILSQPASIKPGVSNTTQTPFASLVHPAFQPSVSLLNPYPHPQAGHAMEDPTNAKTGGDGPPPAIIPSLALTSNSNTSHSTVSSMQSAAPSTASGAAANAPLFTTSHSQQSQQQGTSGAATGVATTAMPFKPQYTHSSPSGPQMMGISPRPAQFTQKPIGMSAGSATNTPNNGLGAMVAQHHDAHGAYHGYPSQPGVGMGMGMVSAGAPPLFYANNASTLPPTAAQTSINTSINMSMLNHPLGPTSLITSGAAGVHPLGSAATVGNTTGLPQQAPAISVLRIPSTNTVAQLTASANPASVLLQYNQSPQRQQSLGSVATSGGFKPPLVKIGSNPSIPPANAVVSVSGGTISSLGTGQTAGTSSSSSATGGSASVTAAGLQPAPAPMIVGPNGGLQLGLQSKPPSVYLQPSVSPRSSAMNNPFPQIKQSSVPSHILPHPGAQQQHMHSSPQYANQFQSPQPQQQQQQQQQQPGALLHALYPSGYMNSVGQQGFGQSANGYSQQPAFSGHGGHQRKPSLQLHGGALGQSQHYPLQGQPYQPGLPRPSSMPPVFSPQQSVLTNSNPYSAGPPPGTAYGQPPGQLQYQNAPQQQQHQGIPSIVAPFGGGGGQYINVSHPPPPMLHRHDPASANVSLVGYEHHHPGYQISPQHQQPVMAQQHSQQQQPYMYHQHQHQLEHVPAYGYQQPPHQGMQQQQQQYGYQYQIPGMSVSRPPSPSQQQLLSSGIVQNNLSTVSDGIRKMFRANNHLQQQQQQHSDASYVILTDSGYQLMAGQHTGDGGESSTGVKSQRQSQQQSASGARAASQSTGNKPRKLGSGAKKGQQQPQIDPVYQQALTDAINNDEIDLELTKKGKVYIPPQAIATSVDARPPGQATTREHSTQRKKFAQLRPRIGGRFVKKSVAKQMIDKHQELVSQDVPGSEDASRPDDLGGGSVTATTTTEHPPLEAASGSGSNSHETTPPSAVEAPSDEKSHLPPANNSTSPNSDSIDEAVAPDGSIGDVEASANHFELDVPSPERTLMMAVTGSETASTPTPHGKTEQQQAALPSSEATPASEHTKQTIAAQSPTPSPDAGIGPHIAVPT